MQTVATSFDAWLADACTSSVEAFSPSELFDSDRCMSAFRAARQRKPFTGVVIPVHYQSKVSRSTATRRNDAASSARLVNSRDGFPGFRSTRNRHPNRPAAAVSANSTDRMSDSHPKVRIPP